MLRGDICERKLADFTDLAKEVSVADAIIIIGGISARMEGEGGDKQDIELPKVQQILLRDMHKTGKPVIFVNCSGSAIAFGSVEGEYDALLQAWYPGQGGAKALAEVLLGDYNPGGKLPVTFHLSDPQYNWAGITRKLTTTDFEAANIEYIEFWMLDPFIYNPGATGGDLYLNLGEVSEDVLLDGKKFFENGMPVNNDSAKWTKTVWGKVPTGKSLVYAFDNTDADARDKQDVGLNGLSSEEERNWPAYASYLDAIRGKLVESDKVKQIK